MTIVDVTRDTPVIAAELGSFHIAMQIGICNIGTTIQLKMYVVIIE